MLTTTTAFDTKNDETYKTPIFIISFDGETVKYANSLRIGDPTIGGYILAEDGSFSLLEDSGFIQLEGSSASPPQFLNYDSGTGTFTAGNTLIGASSGASATIASVTASQLELSHITGTFLDNEVIYEASYGGELVTDTGLESWTGDIPDAPWAKNEAGTSTLTDEAAIKHGDSHSAKFTMDASASYVTLKQAVAYAANSFYMADVWLYGDATNPIAIKDRDLGTGSLNERETPSAAWNNYTYVWQANANSTQIYFKRYSGASWSFYVDDVSVKKITNAALADGVLTSATYSPYLVGISGLSQQITPEEGRSSIGGVEVQLLDVSDEITALLATDTYHFHRKQTTIKVGYVGLLEGEDYISIMVGWVTGLKLSNDGLVYTFSITDPQKWFQRQIFRGSEDSTVTVSGNPIDILLKCITSTGAGTNGNYDVLSEDNGIGLDDSFVDVAGIEAVRDDWFPGDSHYMRFSISERIKAKDFFEQEIFKVLNVYPVIDGLGRFTIKPFKPPIAALDEVQSFTADNTIGLPKLDFNLGSLVNEIQIEYDWNTTTEVYDSEVFYVDATSVNNRGPGKKPITIKSKGLHTSHSPASISGRATSVLGVRKNRIFGRFASPPMSLKLKTFFNRWITEVGDVVPFTHAKVPDVDAGTRGLTAERMEVIKKNVDWRNGTVSFDLLNTGFNKGTYSVISPTMTVVSATDSENFIVSVADAVKYENFTLPEFQLCDSGMRQRVAAKTLLSVNTTTGACTCDALGVTPAAGDFVLFPDYDDATDEQKLYGYIADSDDNLGTADDDAHLIIP